MEINTDANTNQENTQIGRARKFFTLSNANTQKYRCKICEKEISGRKPTNLVAHFKINQPDHKNIYHREIVENDEQHVLVQREEFIHSAVELVTINSQPFSLLSASGYVNGHKRQLERFKLAGCPVNLSNEHVEEIKEKVRITAKQIKEQIISETRHKIVSIMVDTATRNGRSIYGISLQYKHNGLVKDVAIGMRELKESHTAVHLCEVLLKVLTEYEITLNQVISITTDNGSNMLAMIKEVERILLQSENDINPQALGCDGQFAENQSQSAESEQNQRNIDAEIEQLVTESIDDDVLDELLDDGDFYEELFERLVTDLRNQTGNNSLFVNSIKCAAHTIQLAVKDALKLLSNGDRNVITLCRLVAKFLRLQSTKNEMQTEGLKTTLPALDVKTRWSSTYIMIRSILKCKNIIEHFEYRAGCASLLLKKWHVLEELKDILHLPYLSTVMLQKKDFTLSDFYGLLKVMDMKLSKIASREGDNYTNLADNLLRRLNERKERLVENPLMRCAIFLDPRFKCDIDSDNDLVIFVKLTIEHVWKRIQSVKITEQIHEEVNETEARNKSDNMNDLFNELDEEYDAMQASSLQNPDFSKDKGEIAEALHQYEQFVSGTRMKSASSIHEFWERNKCTFGLELYEIASTIFAIPPTQSTVERYFSALKHLFNDYRYNLAEDLLESCLLIHLNPKFYEIVKERDIERVVMSIRKS